VRKQNNSKITRHSKSSYIKQFEHTAANATMEELVEFAFGSIEDAIEAFGKDKVALT